MGNEGKRRPSLERALNKVTGPELRRLRLAPFTFRVRLRAFLMFRLYWILGPRFL